MSDFKAKMHQIRLLLGIHPDPAGGAYSAPSDRLAGFKGPTSKGRGRGGGEMGRGREGKEGEGEEGSLGRNGKGTHSGLDPVPLLFADLRP